ncbi:MAG: hypothetical protein AB7J46_01265 [Candidatus Altimarinota bacterium]
MSTDTLTSMGEILDSRPLTVPMKSHLFAFNKANPFVPVVSDMTRGIFDE